MRYCFPKFCAQTSGPVETRADCANKAQTNRLESFTRHRLDEKGMLAVFACCLLVQSGPDEPALPAVIKKNSNREMNHWKISPGDAISCSLW